jgi:hypothetical protein
MQPELQRQAELLAYHVHLLAAQHLHLRHLLLAELVQRQHAVTPLHQTAQVLLIPELQPEPQRHKALWHRAHHAFRQSPVTKVLLTANAATDFSDAWIRSA